MKSAKLVLATLFLAQPMAAFANGQPLAPSGEWSVLRIGEECRAHRTFGTDEQRVEFELSQSAPSLNYTLAVTGRGFERARTFTPDTRQMFRPGSKRPEGGHQFDMDLTLVGAAAEPVKVRARAAKSVDGRPGLQGSFAFVPPLPDQTKGAKKAGESSMAPGLFAQRQREELAIVRRVQSLLFNLGKESVQLGTPDLLGPILTLRDCTKALVRSWGLDPAEQATLTGPEPIDPANWISWNDYPRTALVRGELALVAFRILTDAQGKATNCAVTYTTLAPSLTPITCDLLMRRAKFKPATTPDGVPRPSYFTSSVLWSLYGY